MEVIGSESGDLNRVVWDDADRFLTAQALIGLVGRLERTKSMDEMLFRECEMDCAFRLADSDWSTAIRAHATGDDVERLEQVRTLVWQSHDLLGREQTGEAAHVLRQVIALKLTEEVSASTTLD